MHTPRSQSLDKGEGLDFLRRVEAWQPRLEGSGLRLAVENKAIRSAADRGYILTPLDRLCAFADRYDLGLVLDTTHAATANVDLVQASRAFDGRLVDLHFSDLGGWVPLGRLRTVQKVLGQHRFPGAGHLLLTSLLAALARDGYIGPVTLEVNPFDVKAWWPPAMRRHLARAVAWMRRASGLQGAAGPAV
jgi:sugar phosphate isomerase/epimerase